MIKKLMDHRMLTVVVVAFLVFGCSDSLPAATAPTSVSPEMPSNAASTTAPIITPELPTHTPTPALDFSSSVAPVLTGQGVSEAAVYDHDSPGPHRMVVITDTGETHDWNALLPTGWIPSSVDEIELVVVVFPEREIELDTRSYIGGPPITRYRYELDVEVREASSAIVRWEGILAGSMPRDFPQTAPVEQTRLEGGSVSAEDLEGWLSCRIEPARACATLTLHGHSDPVGGIAFSPDGQILASGSRDVRIWRVSDGALLQRIEDCGGKVAFSPDGQTLAAVSSEGVQLWRIADSTLLRTLEASSVVSVAFSPDGQILASGSWDEAFVRLWRVSDGSLLRTLDGSGRHVAFSPDGQSLASGSVDENFVRLWRVSDGSLLRVFEGHNHPATSVAFSPDGQILASGSSDLYVHLWRVADGTLLHKLFGHSNTVTSVAFSPDGQILASGSSDTNIHLWRVDDGSLLEELEGHADFVASVAFSPDGRILASASFDQTVRLWQIE